jgi:serine/threonine protein kinase
MNAGPEPSHDSIGPWIYERTLGVGGMASVLLCHHRHIAGLRAAVKLMPGWSADEDAIQRFEREAALLGQLRHPHIVRLIGGSDASGGDKNKAGFWLAMAYVEGPTLDERLDRGPLSVDEVLAVFIPLTRALEYAHAAGVFHRDLKPANMILGPTGVQLVDFGVALSADLSRLTNRGVRPGTLSYMAPEAVLDDRDLPDPGANDLYALGVVLYEALTAKRAFPGNRDGGFHAQQLSILRAKARSPGLDPGEPHPPAWRDVVYRLTQPDPHLRLRDLRVVRELLEQGADVARPASAPVAAEGETVWAQPSPFRSTPRPHRPPRRLLEPRLRRTAGDEVDEPEWEVTPPVASETTTPVAPEPPPQMEPLPTPAEPPARAAPAEAPPRSRPTPLPPLAEEEDDEPMWHDVSPVAPPPPVVAPVSPIELHAPPSLTTPTPSGSRVARPPSIVRVQRAAPAEEAPRATMEVPPYNGLVVAILLSGVLFLLLAAAVVTYAVDLWFERAPAEVAAAPDAAVVVEAEADETPIWHDTGLHQPPRVWPKAGPRLPPPPSPPPPAAGRSVTVSTADGRPARVTIDGRDKGPTPWTGTLSYGRHTIRVAAESRAVSGAPLIAKDGAGTIKADFLYNRLVMHSEAR